MCVCRATTFDRVVSSFVVQNLVNEGNLPPLVLTYIANALFVILILPHAGREWAARCLEQPPQQQQLSFQSGHGGRGSRRRGANTWSIYIHAALCVCPLWFLAMYTFNASLGLTNVTANTILSTTSSLFTYLISVAILKERLMANKVLCILTSMIGSAMVTLADSFSRKNRGGRVGGTDGEWLGNLLCLLSAFLYALYTNLMKKLLPENIGTDASGNGPHEHDDSTADVGGLQRIGRADKRADGDGGSPVSLTKFFGLLGVFNIVMFLPVVLAAQLTGNIDVFSIPSRSIGISVGKGLFDNVLSDYLWACAVLCTSPTVASMGLSIQIPLAMLIEVLVVPGRPSWMESSTAFWMTVGGAVLVTAGFYGVAIITIKGSARRAPRVDGRECDGDSDDESSRLVQDHDCGVPG